MKDLLSALPMEMVQAIADQTEPYDVLALRSTSQKMCAGSNDAFLRHFFTHRRHVLSRHSLLALVSIASNPALRGQLRSLDLVMVQLEEEDVPPQGLLQSRRYARAPKSPSELSEAERQKTIWCKLNYGIRLCGIDYIKETMAKWMEDVKFGNLMY